MAETVSNVEFRTGNSKYPWADYMNGNKWVLKRGTDFDQNLRIRSLQSAAGMYALRHGIRIHTKIIDDDTFAIQAYALKPKGR